MPEGYKIVKYKNNGRLKKYADFFYIFRLYRILKVLKPDVIYQNGESSLISAAAFYSKRYKCNLIWHVASDSNVVDKRKYFLLRHAHKLLDRKLFKYGAKIAHHIIVQTNYQKKIVELFNKNAKTHLVRNYHPFPVELPMATKKNQIIWVANLKLLKRPELFINLSNCLYKNNIDVNCIMIGSPGIHTSSYQQSLEKKINEVPNLFWLNKKPIEVVNDYINESKILVNTSKWEGFPNTYIQAWARETPVVTLSCDPDSLIKDLGIGICSGNFKKLVDDISKLLNDDKLRSTMGQMAKKYALKYHSLDNLAELTSLICN